MFDIPAQLKSGYTRLLQQRAIPQHSHNNLLEVATVLPGLLQQISSCCRSPQFIAPFY